MTEPYRRILPLGRMPIVRRARAAIPSLAGLALAVGLWAAAEPATAQPAGTATASAVPAAQKPLPPGFERVAGAPETEKLDPNPLVIAAYATIFVGMFGYIVYVARSQAAIAKQMMELSERIRRVEKK